MQNPADSAKMKPESNNGVNTMNGTIFNIQKFCINDGPGIRSTVFFKGCPLNCLWCHNPESKAAAPQLFYDAAKCVGCGQCAAVCPRGCHAVSQAGHSYDRTACTGCGACTDGCYTGALERMGRTVTVDKALAEVMKDEIFYRSSGGGMTLSGGEPMAQFAFTQALLTAAKEKGLHTCMETCGFAPAEHFRQIAPLVDIFLFDYKLTDSTEHKKYTGVPNETILANLRLLDELGCATVLRCPIIPGINDTAAHLQGIAQLANSLTHVLNIDLEPYHPLGTKKSAMLGMDYPLAELTFPAEVTVQSWIAQVQGLTAVPVKKA